MDRSSLTIRLHARDAPGFLTPKRSKIKIAADLLFIPTLVVWTRSFPPKIGGCKELFGTEAVSIEPTKQAPTPTIILGVLHGSITPHFCELISFFFM